MLGSLTLFPPQLTDILRICERNSSAQCEQGCDGMRKIERHCHGATYRDWVPLLALMIIQANSAGTAGTGLPVARLWASSSWLMVQQSPTTARILCRYFSGFCADYQLLIFNLCREELTPNTPAATLPISSDPFRRVSI
jgi:hypothetical protein